MGPVARCVLRVDLTTVVPVDMLEEAVLLLIFRSCCCRVAGRAAGDLTGTGWEDFVAVRFVCVVVVVALAVLRTAAGDVVAIFLVSVRVVRARASSIMALSGLEGFNGEAGRDKYEAFVGDVMSGDCL